ncbi:MAG: hypothetical protein EHM39_05525 [Chloroflexi bacterium]|nr:MAG: hypothetical protein EHM39_05525 [Chloroflexota bacterium]
MPDLVRGDQLTEDGRKVIALLDATLDQAEALIEGQNMAPLNALAGPFQDYYINVRKAHLHTPESWLKNRTYAAFALWEQVREQEKTIATAEKADTMEQRLEKLEASIAALLDTRGAPAPIETPAAEAVEPTPEPAPTKATKAKKTQEPEPEAPAAETTAEEPEKADDEKAE